MPKRKKVSAAELRSRREWLAKYSYTPDPILDVTREYHLWWTLTVAILCAGFLILVEQELYRTTLAPILQDVISNYREANRIALAALLYLFKSVLWLDMYTLLYSKFMSPNVYQGLLSLCLVFVVSLLTLHYRAERDVLIASWKRGERKDRMYLYTTIAKELFEVLVLFLLSISLLMLLAPLVALFVVMTSGKSAAEAEDAGYRQNVGFLLMLVIMGAVMSIFYIANAILK